LDVNLWIEALTKPKETFASQKAKADFASAAANYAVAGAIGGLIVYIMSVIGMFPAKMGLEIIIQNAILYPIGAVIGVGIVHLLAGMLGGKGGFTQQYHLMSILAPGLAVGSSIPLVGILIGLYGIYLSVLAVQEVYGLSLGKAAAAVLIPVVIIGVLAAIVAAIVAMVLVGAGAAAAYGG